MIAIVKRWKIVVYSNEFEDSPYEFYIYDNHYSNVLSKLREFHFPIDPKEVRIQSEKT